MDKRSLEKVYRAGLRLLQPLEIEEVYKVICEEAVKIVGGEYATIFLDVQGQLKRVYTTSSVLSQIEIRKNGYTYKVYKTQKPMVLGASTIARIHPEIKKMSARSDILVPLINQKKSIGVFTVLSSHKVEFTDEDMNVLMLFGPMASLAIRKSQFYDETRKALETRDLFISMAAHELRTPLTTINGYSQLLNGRLSKKPESDESRWAYELSREATRMTHLINELLEMNRIKTGQLNYVFQECHLKDVVDRVLRNFNLTHPEQQIILEDKLNHKSDLIIGDFEKLMQAFTNLLDNAAKFSPKGSPLEVVLKLKPGFIVIQVKDRGKGISKKDIPRIFDGFYRGGDNKVEGMGLGLYLVKNILQMHRGDVKIDSSNGEGTTFSMQLPIYDYGQ